jgi:hypothetical protein
MVGDHKRYRCVLFAQQAAHNLVNIQLCHVSSLRVQMLLRTHQVRTCLCPTHTICKVRHSRRRATCLLAGDHTQQRTFDGCKDGSASACQTSCQWALFTSQNVFVGPQRCRGLSVAASRRQQQRVAVKSSYAWPLHTVELCIWQCLQRCPWCNMKVKGPASHVLVLVSACGCHVKRTCTGLHTC